MHHKNFTNLVTPQAAAKLEALLKKMMPLKFLTEN
jgi:hypothetical protein